MALRAFIHHPTDKARRDLSAEGQVEKNDLCSQEHLAFPTHWMAGGSLLA